MNQRVPGYSFKEVNRVPGYPGTPVRGPQILGEYKALLVPVTSICKPGSTYEYPGNWQKRNTREYTPSQKIAKVGAGGRRDWPSRQTRCVEDVNTR